MKIPDAGKVVIDREKIVDYLLNSSHPDNGGKSSFFHKLGFYPDDWLALAEAFRTLAESAEIVGSQTSSHGQKHIVIGRIISPAGKSSLVKTIWIMDNGAETVRLVTAYPHEN